MIRELLSRQSIQTGLSGDLDQALRRMLDSSDVECTPQLLAELRSSAERPEGASGPAIFPHAALHGINSPRLHIGIVSGKSATRSTLSFRIIAILLTPLNDPERSLALLARLAALLPPLVGELSRMRDAESIRQRIAAAEGQAQGPTYFNMSQSDLALELSTDLQRGLSEAEANRRLQRYGKNALRARRRTPWTLRLMRSFFSFFAILLWGAAALCFAPGVDLPQLGLAIFVVIGVNGIFSFLQEARTDRAVETLQRMLAHRCRVLRDGEVREIDAELATPGDVILLDEGDAVPADARLIDATELEVDNSLLTGESASARRYKSDRPVLIDKPFLWIEMPNVVFAGSTVQRGAARAVVFGVGMNTEIGRIAGMTQAIRAEDTPLQRQLRGTVKTIALLAAVMGAVFLGLGWQFAGLHFSQALVFCIGLFVANVPEGLLPTVTLSLALGVQRMARRNAIVKNLSSVETLGCTTVICTDKTGTLTQNVMSVTDLLAGGELFSVSGTGYAPSGELKVKGQAISIDRLDRRPALLELLRCAYVCNNAHLRREGGEWKLSGDPTEGALMALALKGGMQGARQNLRLFPFESVRKRMSVVVRSTAGDGGAIVYAKGAPLELLERCDRAWMESGVEILKDDLRAKIREQNDRFAAEGLRVLALACRQDSAAEGMTDSQEDAESRLIFLGLAAIRDPVRPQVAEAIAACHQAGIRIVMITGDYARTAESIGQQIAMNLTSSGRSYSGSELAELTDADLAQLLAQGDSIFARVSPEQKLRIVNILREAGEIVAVTGDGVNDAPALKRAHIGIAMGKRGSDVAREAAHMVLADDNFSSIVAAIEEGRAIFRNIRRFIAYVLNSNPQEMAPYILWMLFPGTPLAMTVMGVLAVDVGTDLLPAMGLGVEPPESDVMRRPPRKQNERLLSIGLILKSYLIRGSILTAACYGAYLFFGWSQGLFSDGISLLSMPASPEGLDMSKASPAYLMSLSAFFIPTVTTQIVNVLCKRSDTRSLFDRNFLAESRRASMLQSLRRTRLPGRYPRLLRASAQRIVIALSSTLEKHWIWMNLVSNPLITVGIFFEVLFLVCLVYTPLNTIYYFAPAPWSVFVAALAGPLLLLLFDEGIKFLRRRGWRMRLVSEDDG
ncbi:MAG: cation-transporting P-type ATPase [Leptospirales bacterium]|nr:cation-transporting P-type ATPase [Leptospirales bacterium]